MSSHRHNSPLSTSSPPHSRLSQISSHVAPMATSTSFDASTVPQAPEDPLFGLMAAFRRDTDPNKVDLVSRITTYLLPYYLSKMGHS